MIKFSQFLSACLVAAFLMVGVVQAQTTRYGGGNIPVREIRITGAQRIEPATVMTYMDVRVGDVMTPGSLDRVLKSLFATGLFSDVRLRQDGSILEVLVEENPVINRIAFEGNEKLDDEALLAEVRLRSRQVFTRTKVQADVSRLYQVYRRNGRFSVVIEPKVVKLDRNRVDLVFEVEEGEITKVQGVRFVGNKHYSDDKLRSEISTKESRWYRFISSDDRYDPDRVSFDEELLRRFYLSQGYADFRIVSAVAELSKNREDFLLTFTVEEGQRYRVADVALQSYIRHFDATVLKEHVTVEPGEWYDSREVESTVDALTSELGNRQYAFVSVKPEINRRPEAQEVDLVLRINETPRVFVERIDIQGNVRTLDKVVRREMELVEGDPFNRAKLAESEQDIRDLDYFESVTVTPRAGSAPDKTVIDVEVAEKSTGELSLGAGFSSSDGPLADIRIRERNLLGKGQDLLLGATVAGERTQFDIAFTEPHFLGRDFSAGIDAFHTTRDLQDESSFDQRRTGGGLRFGYPLSEKWRQILRYRLEQNDITDVQSDASLFIREQEGQRITSAVSQRLVYDDRDSTLFPTRGLTSWLDTELAGLGGDAEYISGRLGASYYYPIADQWIFNLLGEGGAIAGLRDEDVKINERFFLGGSTLRGFDTAGVGPRDQVTNDSLGGNYFYRGTAELSFPLGLPEELGVRGHGFTDWGTLWEIDTVSTSSGIFDESTLRASAGVGVSWRSPLGPIRVDLAVPYLEEDFDETETFRFNFGTRF